MLREQPNVQRMHWADKTMSMMRLQGIEACEARLKALPPRALFAPDATDQDAEELWACSYDAMNAPRFDRLHTIRDMRSMVLGRLAEEAALLSIDEHLLLERLIVFGGSAELMDDDDLGPMESLVRRLWCRHEMRGDRHFIVLPEELLVPMTLAVSSQQHEEFREKIYELEAKISAKLYLLGLMPEEIPLKYMMEQVMKGTYVQDRELVRRFLRVTFDCVMDRNGRIQLLHSGLAEPERYLGQCLPADAFNMEGSLDEMGVAALDVLEEETELAGELALCVDSATRPETNGYFVARDLRILAKQGVPLSVMNEVLASMLIMMPTRHMLDLVRRTCETTPRWGSMSMALMH